MGLGTRHDCPVCDIVLYLLGKWSYPEFEYKHFFRLLRLLLRTQPFLQQLSPRSQLSSTLWMMLLGMAARIYLLRVLCN